LQGAKVRNKKGFKDSFLAILWLRAHVEKILWG
jgi:hypothetical protein